MGSPDPLAKLKQQIWRATEQDGLAQIIAGVVLLITPLITGNPFFVGFFLFVILLGRRFIYRLKEKITYPRIGYVALADERNAKFDVKGLFFIVAIIAFWVTAVVLLGGASERLTWYRWAPTLVALLFLGMFQFLVEKSGQKIYYLMAVLSLVGAVAIAFLDFDYRFAWTTLYCAGLGGLFILLGVAKMIVFFRKYPRHNEQAALGE